MEAFEYKVKHIIDYPPMGAHFVQGVSFGVPPLSFALVVSGTPNANGYKTGRIIDAIMKRDTRTVYDLQGVSDAQANAKERARAEALLALLDQDLASLPGGSSP